MAFLTGSDWSTSLNSPTSLGQAQILEVLGRQLREKYEPFVKEPLPDQLGSLIERLEHQGSDPGRDGTT